MSDDLSRFLKQPFKHYSGARLQQGRVLLDSDFNESSWLEEEDNRRAWADIVGPQGSPDVGFSLGLLFSPPSDPLPEEDSFLARTVVINGIDQSIYDFTLRPGTMFIGGNRYDLESTTPVAFQRDYLQLRQVDETLTVQPLETLPLARTDGEDFRYLYYLHAWDQCVTATEDQEIAEAMLQGPDTSVRIRRMRRVQVLEVGDTDDNCASAFADLKTRLEENGNAALEGFELVSKALLRLAFVEGDVGDTCAPCDPNDPVFLGSENTTLRIMLTAPDRFVWALDNGAPLFRVKITGFDNAANPLVVEMLTPPADERQLPTENRVVEILPFAALLEGGDLPAESADPHFKKIAAETGVLARVSGSFDRENGTFLLRNDDPGADEDVFEAIKALVHQWDQNHPDFAALDVNTSDERFFYMRMWHQSSDAAETIDISTEDPVVLGDLGIEANLNGLGVRGDFWTATVRLETPGRVSPFDLMKLPDGVPPHGPRHFYAPVALVHGEHALDAGENSEVAELIDNGECRARLRRIGDRGCVTLTVGDGIISSGDYRSIEDAVEALPGSGGRIAVRPGHYEEEILIEGRRNITIEGCGAASVVTTPNAPRSGILFEVRDSDGITITGLSLRAAEQTAFTARRVTDLVLRDIAAVAGSFTVDVPEGDEPEFLPGVTLSGAALVELVQVGSAELDALNLRPAQRTGLSLVRSELVSINQLTALGIDESAAPPSGALVSIVDSELVRMDDATLEAFGQVGVSIRGSQSRDIELRELTIFGSTCEFQPARDAEDESEAELPFQIASAASAVDIDNGDGVRLHRSRILLTGGIVSEHACVALRGRNISVENNVIETSFVCTALKHDHGPEGESGDEGENDPQPSPPPGGESGEEAEAVGLCGAFGGVQVRGGSTAVEIRGNRIEKGLGHGITIGSVLWHDSEEPASRARRVGGAGTGQLARETVTIGEGDELELVVIGRDLGAGFQDEGDHLLPVSEGTIRDLVIADNTIQDMYGSGISVLTVLGLLARTTQFIEVEGGRIEGNRIESNVVHPGKDLPDMGDVFPFPGSVFGPAVISVLPFGGIVLGSATAGVDIRNNLIRNNARVIRDGAIDVNNAPLPVCGIFVLHGEGIGITGNRITDNGVRATVAEYLPGVRAGIAVMLAGTGSADDLRDVRRALAGRTALRHSNSSLRVVNNVVLHPEGRALHVVAAGPVTIDGNYFASQGNHGAELQSDRYMIGDVVFVQDVGTPWEASAFNLTSGSSGTLAEIVTAPATEDAPPTLGDFAEAPHALAYLTNQQEDSPWYFVGDGGQVLFNNNQVVYDWDVSTTQSLKSRAPLAFFPAAVIGLDHVAVNGNQFAMRLNGAATRPPLTVPPFTIPERMLAHLLVLGATVEVSRNRISENVGSVVLSMITNADIMNLTALNQTTHVNAAFVMASETPAFADPNPDPAASKFLRNEDNQVMFIKDWFIDGTPVENTLTDTSPGPPEAFLNRIRRTLRRSFLRILQNQSR